MARNVSPFKLGLFIVVGGCLGLAAIIFFGTSTLFEDSKTYITYFSESVKGLQKDAVINYRGVGVGRVSQIGLAPDGRLIGVVMELSKEFQVDPSLSIQLREQGLTGLRYLEIDKAPQDLASLTPPLNFESPYPVIPSYPSELEQLKSALESLYNKIYALDIEKLAQNWTRTAELVNKVLEKIDVAIDPEDWKQTAVAVRKTAQDSSVLVERFSKAASQNRLNEGFQDLTASLEATRQATESIAKQLKGLPPDAVAKMSASWNKTFTSGGTALENADRHVGESAVVLQQSLQQFKLLLTQMNGLIQSLKEKPNQLIFPADEPDPFKRK